MFRFSLNLCEERRHSVNDFIFNKKDKKMDLDDLEEKAAFKILSAYSKEKDGILINDVALMKFIRMDDSELELRINETDPVLMLVAALNICYEKQIKVTMCNLVKKEKVISK